MKQSYLLLVLLVLASFNVVAQKKNIKVQIMHNNVLVLDTSIHKSSNEAKIIIKELVQQYSSDPVIIDSKLTHGLYVFNITDESWKEPKTPVKKVEPKQEQVKVTQEMNIEEPEEWAWDEKDKSTSTDNIEDEDFDELFKEFSEEINDNWDQEQVEILVDSLGASFEYLWDEFKKVDFSDNPDIQDLKTDFRDFFNDLRKTQFIIIHDGDTVDYN